MARGNGRMRIFNDDTDYRRFLYILGDVVEECGLDCWNYCAMPNHYHCTLVASRPNLSESIRRLNSAYAQWWNARHGRVGHVFQGRFKDQIVQREGYLLALSRYVVMNPVRARLVERPHEWPWSSYRATAGLIPCPSFLNPRATLELFGEADESLQRARFTQYVESELGDESTAERIRSNERILGTRAFKVLLNRPVALDGGPRGIDQMAGLPGAAIDRCITDFNLP